MTEGPFAKGRLVARRHRDRQAAAADIDVPNAHQGSLSPDGRTVAFVVSENGFDGVPNDWNEELWTARTSDGGGLRRLTTRSGNDHWPVAWARTASRWCGRRTTRRAAPDLYIASATGKDVRRLTSDPGYDAWPSWAPHP